MSPQRERNHARIARFALNPPVGSHDRNRRIFRDRRVLALRPEALSSITFPSLASVIAPTHDRVSPNEMSVGWMDNVRDDG